MGKRADVRTAASRIELPGKGNVPCVRLYDDERGVRVSVVPAAGGEIAGMSLRIGGRRRQLLYRAMDYRTQPPDGFDGRAPLLWPAVGRFHTDEQVARWRVTGRKPRSYRYRVRGRDYAMRIHGFARDMAWALDACGADRESAWVACSLKDSAATWRQYPFRFELRVTHMLRRGAVTSRYELAAGANDSEMPFCIGNHISFRLPFTGSGSYGACMLRTPGKRKVRFDELMLPEGASRGDLSRPVPLATGVYRDTMMTGYSRRTAWAEIVDPASIRLRISQAEKPVWGRFTGRERDIGFVFWGKPEFGQLCPEPWMGRPNALNTGKGLLRLRPGGRFVWEMRVEFAGV